MEQLEFLQSFNDLPLDTPVYIFCKNYGEFLEYQKSHPTYKCIYIEDGVTLRGRTPGIILELPEADLNSKAFEIEDSIEIYRPLFEQQLTKRIEEVDNSRVDDYGI